VKPLVRAAPEGVRAAWFVSDDGSTLIIEVSDKLDKVTRQRYIQQALDEHDIEPRRRSTAVPLIVGAGAGVHRAVRQHAVGTAIVSGAVVTGVAVALVLPGMFDGNQNTINQRPVTPPAAVQPTPPRSGPAQPPNPRTAQPVSGTVPASPTVSPATSSPGTPTYLVPRVRVPGGHAVRRLHPIRRLQPITGPLPMPMPLPRPLPRPLHGPLSQLRPTSCLLNLDPLIHAGAVCPGVLITRSP
jgi:hypothetical protein